MSSAELMTYVEAPEKWMPDPRTARPSLFLAGGITACEDWQARVREMLAGRDIVVLNPRRADFDVANGASAEQQVRWEYAHLHLVSVTLFWFPACDPAQTVQPIALFELGSAIAEHRAGAVVGGRDRVPRLFVVGADPAYPRRQDIVLQMQNALPGAPVHATLDQTVGAALTLAWATRPWSPTDAR